MISGLCNSWTTQQTSEAPSRPMSPPEDRTPFLDLACWHWLAMVSTQRTLLPATNTIKKASSFVRHFFRKWMDARGFNQMPANRFQQSRCLLSPPSGLNDVRSRTRLGRAAFWEACCWFEAIALLTGGHSPSNVPVVAAVSRPLLQDWKRLAIRIAKIASTQRIKARLNASDKLSEKSKRVELYLLPSMAQKGTSV